MNSVRALSLARSGPSTAPISHLNSDVLLLIFEAIVTEVNIDIGGDINKWKIRTTSTAVTLSRVCRRWKDIVYHSPSLWRIIVLDLTGDPSQVQAKCDLQALLAKDVPISLYLQHVVAPTKGCKSTSNTTSRITCSSCKGSLSLSLDAISNIQNLHMHAACHDASKIFSASNLSSLRNLQVLGLSLIDSGTGIPELSSFDIFHLLSHTPQLTSLSLKNVLGLQLRNSDAGAGPSLQRLRDLTISCTDLNHVNYNTLIEFLSSCPNIEILRFRPLRLNYWRNDPSSPPYTFSSLRTIVTDKFKSVLRISPWFRTPVLDTLQIGFWNNEMPRTLRTFLAANPTVRKISISVTSDSRYDLSLQDALNIEDLSISGFGDGQWLTPLYLSTITDGLTGRPMLTAPNLRRIHIHLRDVPVSRNFFEGLVRVRFMATDAEGHTAAGCKAADVLKITVARPTLISSGLTSSPAWRQAKVTRLSLTEYELRWPNRPRPKESLALSLEKMTIEIGNDDEEDEEDYHIFL